MSVKFANRVTSTLQEPLNDTVTYMRVPGKDGPMFPTLTARDWFYLTITHPDTGEYEIVKATTNSGGASSGYTRFDIVRAQEGTTAKAFPVGSSVELRLSSAALDDLKFEPELELTTIFEQAPGSSSVSSPITREGFYRVLVIGGGGAGGSTGANGVSGESSTLTITNMIGYLGDIKVYAKGGSGGGGSKPSISKPETGDYSSYHSGAAGGGAGEVVDTVLYLVPGGTWSAFTGAGGSNPTPRIHPITGVYTLGRAGKGAGGGESGMEVPQYAPDYTFTDEPQFVGTGGAGGSNSTIYGAGGGGAAGYLTHLPPTSPRLEQVLGGQKGESSSNASNGGNAVYGGTTPVVGGRGASGYISVSYLGTMPPKS